MKKIVVVVAAIMLVSCAKDIDSPTGLSFSVMNRKSSLAAVATGFSAKIKIYSDNGRIQYVLDSISIRLGTGAKDTTNLVNEYINNDLAFVRSGQEMYAVGLTSLVDSIPFIIKNPTLSYYAMQITIVNAPQGLYLRDGAGVVLSETDITPTFTALGEGDNKYSFSAQKQFGVSLSSRFALIYKP